MPPSLLFTVLPRDGPSPCGLIRTPLHWAFCEAPVNDSQPNEAPIPVPPTLAPPLTGLPATTPPDPVILVPPITPSVIEAPDSKWITHLSSLIVVSISAAYLIGFIVVNTSLFDYGMVPYDFLQARYVSAGLLYLASTVGLTGFVFLMIHLTRKKFYLHDKINAEFKSAALILFVFAVIGPRLDWLLPKSQDIPWWLQSLSWPSFILALAVGLLNSTAIPFPKKYQGGRVDLWWRKHLWEGGWASWIVLSLVLVNFLAKLGYAFIFYPCFLGGILYFYFGFKSYESQHEAFKKYTDGLMYGVLLLGVSVWVYAVITYPLISPHVGGGKPLLASISLTQEHRQIIGHIMGREDSNCVMHNISLIHENSELIYVLPHGYLANDAAIAIPKRELISIVYQKKENKEKSTCLEKSGG